jgi:hypothetical protein
MYAALGTVSPSEPMLPVYWSAIKVPERFPEGSAHFCGKVIVLDFDHNAVLDTAPPSVLKLPVGWLATKVPALSWSLYRLLSIRQSTPYEALRLSTACISSPRSSLSCRKHESRRRESYPGHTRGQAHQRLPLLIFHCPIPSADRVNQQSCELEDEEARLGFCHHPDSPTQP